jgi:hypothetical protein
VKRLIAAVSFAALAVPAFAVEVGLPYSQDQVDRALPNVSKVFGDASASRFGAPYDQNLIDRALPNVEEHRSSSAGDSVNRAIANDAAPVSPWANDHHFIAPAQ